MTMSEGSVLLEIDGNGVGNDLGFTIINRCVAFKVDDLFIVIVEYTISSIKERILDGRLDLQRVNSYRQAVGFGLCMQWIDSIKKKS